MMWGPLITVVTPNFNEEEYLPQFLESIAQQIYGNVELIVVDGGSTDGSLNLLRSFKSVPSLVIVDKTRNIGYIRNLGGHYARGTIQFHTNSDTFLPPELLMRIMNLFAENPRLASVSGRTRPLKASFMCSLAYHAFDLVRWAATYTLGKYRPGGSFFSIRTNVFKAIGGFPEVRINEDGRLGEKLAGMPVKFDLGLWVGHHAKRFQNLGSAKTLLYYSYIFGNYAPALRRLLKTREAQAAAVFTSKSNKGVV